MNLNLDISSIEFKEFNITVNRLSKSQGNSMPSQNLSKIIVKAPIVYEAFTADDGEYIFVPIYREKEYSSHLCIRGFEHITTSDAKYSKILPCTQPVSFFYKPNLVVNKKQATNFLVVMTVFYYETNQELDIFFKYYRGQGVEKFYMYYNGEMSNRTTPLPIYADVEYIEWNFNYWLWRTNSKHPQHHAQIPAINVFVKKYKHQFKYAILADTDEFILVKNYKKIKDYLIEGNVCRSLFTSHYYSNINFETGEITREKNSSHHGLRAGKTILYTEDVNPFSLFSVHQSLNAIHVPDVKLFHNKPQHSRVEQSKEKHEHFAIS
jgi:hypothetical protein